MGVLIIFGWAAAGFASRAGRLGVDLGWRVAGKGGCTADGDEDSPPAARLLWFETLTARRDRCGCEVMSEKYEMTGPLDAVWPGVGGRTGFLKYDMVIVQFLLETSSRPVGHVAPASCQSQPQMIKPQLRPCQ
jgi:hypothetical protein